MHCKAARMATIFMSAGCSHRSQLQDHSVAALAAPKFFHGRDQILFSEVGPQLWRDVHLSVGSLPKKEVRQAHFAGSANKEIWVGIVAGVKMFAEHLYVDHCPIDVTKFNRAKQTFDAINDLEPAAVAQGQDKGETSVASGLLDGFVELLLRTRGQISQASNCLKTHIFFDQFRRLLPQNFFQQTHQRNDLRFWSLPVFSGKSVKREVFHL